MSMLSLSIRENWSRKVGSKLLNQESVDCLDWMSGWDVATWDVESELRRGMAERSSCVLVYWAVTSWMDGSVISSSSDESDPVWAAVL